MKKQQGNLYLLRNGAMKNKHFLPLLALALLISICMACGTSQKEKAYDIIADNTQNAVAQYTLMTDIIEKSGKILNPRTILEDGSIWYVPIDDWCSGFFPGCMWYLHELTGDNKWKGLAEKYTEDMDSFCRCSSRCYLRYVFSSYTSHPHFKKLTYAGYPQCRLCKETEKKKNSFTKKF